ncbi:MAG: 2-oxoacid:acceptor oxidoreductase family protein [Patescibacteria group bacterium]|jgi:pyruvate ferredoxin oxidoreductase gamma subunit
MISIRFHGRGGQGAVTAAELLALAAFHEGQFAQAFPSFGVERQGAPLEAYCRISTKPITLRSQVTEPDFLVIQDASLLADPKTFQGIKPTTIAIINSIKSPTELQLPPKLKVKTVAATSVALEFLGQPLINTAILGALCQTSKLFKLESLNLAIKEKFADKGEAVVTKNLQAAQKAYEIV